MALGSCACRSPCVNSPVNPAGELDELAGAQGPARRSNAWSDKAPTEALTPPEALNPPLVPLPTKNLFTRFMKVFMETTQAQARTELRECPFKIKTSETYSGKSHIDCYHFCSAMWGLFRNLRRHKDESYPFCRHIPPWHCQPHMGPTQAPPQKRYSDHIAWVQELPPKRSRRLPSLYQ